MDGITGGCNGFRVKPELRGKPSPLLSAASGGVLRLPNPLIREETSHSTLEEYRPPFPAVSKMADWLVRWSDVRSPRVGGGL